MATHGDHPPLPDHLESLLMEDVHTVFLKADCPPRVKRGSIGSLKLVEVDASTTAWDTLQLEQLETDLLDLVEEQVEKVRFELLELERVPSRG